MGELLRSIAIIDVGCQKYFCCFMCVIVGLTTVDKLEVFYIDNTQKAINKKKQLIAKASFKSDCVSLTIIKGKYSLSQRSSVTAIRQCTV